VKYFALGILIILLTVTIVNYSGYCDIKTEYSELRKDQLVTQATLVEQHIQILSIINDPKLDTQDKKIAAYCQLIKKNNILDEINKKRNTTALVKFCH
jgi:hypothetical protein